MKPLTEDQFWNRVDKSPGQGPNGTCWEWTGTREANGYARIRRNGRNIGVHRASYLFTHGAIPDDLPIILHTCDNPPCVNPDHLVAGTLSDNTKDGIAKGRIIPAKMWDSTRRFRPEQAEVIRKQAVEGVNQSVIAARYGVHQSTISRLVSGRKGRAS